MTDVAALVARCKAAGITLSVEGSALYLSASRAPDEALKAAIRANKQALVDYLAPSREARPVAPPGSAPGPASVPAVEAAPSPAVAPKPRYSSCPPLTIRLNQRRRIMNDIRMGRRAPDDW